jgi:hypothetical protein
VPAEQEIGIEGVGDVRDVRESDLGLAQAVVDGVIGELMGREGGGALAMLDVGEALLFRRGDHVSIAHEARRRVMKGGADAQGIHRGSLLADNAPLAARQ